MSKLILWSIRTFFVALGRIAPGIAGQLAFKLFCTPWPRSKVSPKDLEVLARAESSDLMHREKTLRIYRWRGPALEGSALRRTVLLVHGWGSQAARLSKWVPALVERGFDVVALDGPAHGASQGKRTQMPEFVDALHTVDDAMGPFHAVIGHSFGAAATALAVAGSHLTGLPALRAESLVLMAGPNRVIDVISRFAEQLGWNDAVVAGVHSEIENIGGYPIEAYSVAPLLAACATPTLVVHDLQDAEIPFADAEAITAAAATATLLSSEGLGHHRIARDPGIITRVLAFLAGEGRTAKRRAVA